MDERILITGGTGSFGRACVSRLLDNHNPKRVVIFSRDELKQYEMKQEFNNDRLRFFVGDVRDRDRLYRAFQGVNTVIHAAALKQVPTAEYNPFEVVKTNILGSQNIVEAAIDCGVKKVIALSTDKACNPVNLYGATKLCMEKLFINGNAYAGGRENRTKFSVVRYGNVWGSRGSVVELFEKQKATGIITITNPDMTRFWIKLPNAVSFVLSMLPIMRGGEVLVPKMESSYIHQVAQDVAPGCMVKVIGTRPGERLHEILITEEEGKRTWDCGNFYTIEPELDWWVRGKMEGTTMVKVPTNFVYRSGGR